MITISAFRGEQGGRTFFQLMMTNRLIADFFEVAFDEDPEQRSQRPLDQRHAAKISQYVVDNRSDYVLGALVYAVQREPVFRSDGGQLGELVLDAKDAYRSIDGQHRHRGIQLAVAAGSEAADDFSAVLVYVEGDVEARRQMFVDMNAPAKRVPKNLNVAFNKRDPFSIAARIVAMETPLRGHVEMLKQQPSPNSKCWIALSALQAIAELLDRDTHRAWVKGQLVNSEDDRKAAVESISRTLRDFFSMLVATRPEIREACTDAVDIRALRRESLLISSASMRALADAVAKWRRDQEESEFADVAGRVAAIDFRPENPLWTEIGFVAPGEFTPQSRAQEMKAAAVSIAALLRDGG